MPRDSIKTDQVNLIEIDESHDGQRIDNYLLSVLKGAPRSLVYRLLRKGEVRVNKKRTKPDQRLSAGDVVRIAPVRIEEKKTDEGLRLSDKQLADLESAVLFEDDFYIAINKASGLAVHGGSGIKLGLIEQLRLARPKAKFLELVHRLDRDTSGVVLVAKKRTALVEVQKLFQGQKAIDKRYLAIVHGEWPASVDRIDAPLLKNELQGGERMVQVDEGGKDSLTKYRLLATASRYSLVEARPITGRTHQIRVHCQYAGHAIAGDPKYLNRIDKEVDKNAAVKRLCLHAYRLAFIHPMTGELLELTCPPEGKMLNYMKKEGVEFEI